MVFLLLPQYQALYFLISAYDLARLHLNKALLINPTDYLSLYYLGLCNFQEKDYINAAKLFKRSIKLEPDHPESHFNLALIYNILGKTREVKKEMNIIYMLDQTLHNQLETELIKNKK